MTEHIQISKIKYDWHLGESTYLTEVLAPHIEVWWYGRTGAGLALLYVMGAGFQLRTQNPGKGKVEEKRSCLFLTNQRTDLHTYMHKSHSYGKNMNYVQNFILSMMI